MDSTETTERLGESTKTIDWIEEGRVTILAHGLHVENGLSGKLKSWSLQVGVISIKGDSMAQEISGLTVKTELAK